jgi:hypothetical protein
MKIHYCWKGKKKFLTGLKGLYLFMQLTDWLSLSGAAAHCCLAKIFLPKTSFNHPSVIE